LTSYRIHRAGEEDEEECLALWERFFGDCSEKPKPGTEWWIAEELGEVAGFASARILEDGSCYLSSAGVLAAHRGQGLQLRLIRARCQWGKKQGAEYALTYTMSYNVKSANSLIHAGFKLYLPKEPWFDTADVLYWRKKL
jgi:GNAT superfamily N-acetyltransferase